jgi:preprotein translocase subunit SecD
LYREIGLVACVSILFYIGIMIFFMQAIPIITISSASLGAILLGLILVSTCHFIMLEKIKSEYAIGKKLNISVKMGYKKSINVIADICGILVIASLVGFFVCTGLLKSFMMLLMVGSLISCFSSLFLGYQLFTSYTFFNKNNGKKVNFTREENVDEIE